jgi:hypothetical protein
VAIAPVVGAVLERNVPELTNSNQTGADDGKDGNPDARHLARSGGVLHAHGKVQSFNPASQFPSLAESLPQRTNEQSLQVTMVQSDGIAQ